MRRFAARAVWLFALALALVARARADQGNALPPGYEVRTEDTVRWTFPKAAASEVDALRVARRRVWPQLAMQLGVDLEPSIDIRIAVNPDDMNALAPPGRSLPAYASGVAFPAEGIILLSFTAPETWIRPDMETLLVHELSHVALHRALNGHAVPRWFAEGLAIAHSGEHSLARIRTLWAASLEGGLIPLRELSSGFGARHGEVDLAYSQAADFVGFMMDTEARAAQLRALSGRLAAGEAFQPAFAAAYGTSLADFEYSWRVHVAQRFGRWPSILSGLTVVWALAALLLVVGYLRVRGRQRRTLQRWALEEAPLEQPEPSATLQPPPPPLPRNAADVVLDAWVDQQRHDAGIPTIVHEGRSYTLH